MNNGSNIAAPAQGVDIADWRPEDAQFWESTGRRIANRNLWISIPNLLVAFAVWLMWGIITVQMLNLGFPFTPAQLFTLTAIAGPGGRHAAHPGVVLHPALRRAQHGVHDQRAADHPRGLDRHRPAGQEHAAVGVPGLRVPVRRGWRQLLRVDEQHQHVLSEEGAGSGARAECGPGQLRRHDDAGADPAGDDRQRVRCVRRRPDGADQGLRMDPRQDCSRHADLDPERRLHLGGDPGAAGDRGLVRHEQPAADHAQPRRLAGRLLQDRLPLWPGLCRRRGGPVFLPSCTHGARPAQHVDRTAADHRCDRGGDEARGVRERCEAISPSSSRYSTTSTPGR